KHDARAFVARIVQHELGIRFLVRQVAPIVEKHAAISLASLQLQKLLRDHLVGVDVHAIQRRDESCVLDEGVHRFSGCYSAPSTSQVRTSTKWPSIAAAAAISGLTRCVRLPLPWRPSKLRFDVLAERSPAGRTSSFMPMHMLQPASRHSNPASRKILSRPSFSASTFTRREPGTTSACLSDFATCLPATTFAAARKSSRREFVQEPMKTRSTKMSCIGVPGSSAMYSRARSAAFWSTGSLKECGSGTRLVTCVTMPGFVPQVTIGASSSACSVIVSSYCAPGSVARDFQ